MSEDNPTGVSVTIKAGTGFDVPWIVLHGKDVAHVRQMLLELSQSDLTAGVAAVARGFHNTYASANPAGSGSSAVAPAQQSSQPSQPPPPFVADSSAQPAGWSTPGSNPQQVMQQQLGAQVVGQFPNELGMCPTHNAPRQYYSGGVGRESKKEYGPSLRCQIKGCPPVWQNRDGSWS